MNIELKDEVYDYKNTSLLDVLPKNEWTDFFKTQKIELKDISDEIKRQATEDEEILFPSVENVFRIFHNIPPNNIKICILGMSPYETIDKLTKTNNAVGIAFSIPKKRKLNPSIRNILNEVKSCGYKIGHFGNLDKWVENGVFLLNVSLTVIKDMANSHLKLYENFMINLIKYLDTLNIVFLLWGGDAQKYKKYLKNNNIIMCSHPSGYSHNSTNNPFTGSKCFLKVNELLKKLKKESINWDTI